MSDNLFGKIFGRKKMTAEELSEHNRINDLLLKSEKELLNGRYKYGLELSEEALKQLKSENSALLAKLEQKRQVLQTLMNQMQARRTEEVKKLSKLYESMKADKASMIFKEEMMTVQMAADILINMEAKKAAKILDELSAEPKGAKKAVGISEKITKIGTE